MGINKLAALLTLLGASAFAFAHEIDIAKFFNELQGQIGYEGTDIKGKSRSIEDLEVQGVKDKENGNECTKSDCKVTGIFGNEAVKKRQEKNEEIGIIRNQDGYVENNKGYLDKALHIVKNADKEFDSLKSSGEASSVCIPGEEIVTDTIIKTCDEYYQMGEPSCFSKQVVEIDPKYHYQCSKRREVKEKTCTDIVSLKCQKSEECELGNIELLSPDPDDLTLFPEKGILKIGTNHLNYWGGSNCNLYEKTATFKLKDIRVIKYFTLYYVRFDDYIEIFVNGTSVYAGPDGGENLHKVSERHQINNGHFLRDCERNTDWQRHVNIDLKPYLKDGDNEIKMKVFVQGLGHGYMEIRAKQNCCTNWDIKREEKCEYQ